MYKTNLCLLPKTFYLGNDVVEIARLLVGKIISTVIDGVITSGIIVETEAYRGPEDQACHAKNGIRTPRTEVMYHEGGILYVYICYGIHPMINIVTGAEGEAHAVLIRAIEPLEGIETMFERRKFCRTIRDLTSGPGKVATALGIHKVHQGEPVWKISDAVLQIHDAGLDSCNIIEGYRVGMSKHTGPCAFRPWRFYMKNNHFVSRPLYVQYPAAWKSENI
jgi:DNA-3-methyladenine glycosylase